MDESSPGFGVVHDQAVKPDSGGKEFSVDPLRVLGMLWTHRIALVIFGLIGLVAGIAISFAVRDLYFAEATLLPQSSADGEGILGRLAQMSNAELRPDRIDDYLYSTVLFSDRVLDPILFRRWPVNATGDSITLGELFKISNSTQAFSEIASREVKIKLRENVMRFDRDPTTGVMRVGAVVPEYPSVASEIANALVRELDVAQGKLATERARAHRAFIQGRLDEVQINLESAEKQTSVFAASNRNFESSPDMSRRFRVLEREAQAYGAVWLQLRTELEKAIVEENRNLSAVKILDNARPPSQRTYPNRMLFGLIGGIISSIVGLVGVQSYRFWKYRADHV